MTPTFKVSSANLFDKTQQPWESMMDGYEANPPIPSMICCHELKFLRYVAETQYSGNGAIVDLGPLAGSSTYALASGARTATIYSYDLWRHFPGCERFTGTKLRVGADILPYFLANTARFGERVIARKCDLTQERWKDGPIELLFIDAAKSPGAMRNIANEFFPHLLRGALIIHQDWVSAEDPWIHIAMGYLSPYFEIMDSPEGGTLCFRVTQRIPANSLTASFLDEPDGYRYFATARSMLPGWHGLCVWLAEAHHCVLVGDTASAGRIMAQVQQHNLFNREQIGYDVAIVERALSSRKRYGLRGRIRESVRDLLRFASF